MPKKTRKATALILIFLLLAANLMAELAHHHFAPSARQAGKNLTWQNQSPLPKIKSAQLLCLACLFASENQSTGSELTFFSSLPSFPFAPPTTTLLFSQLQKTPCRNRAPPA
jgi:hypothetical protein